MEQCCALLFLLSMALLGREVAIQEQAVSAAVLTNRPAQVVIDVGHGGFDPGKVGMNGILEKDVNLAIAERVARYLEALDVEVTLTRQEDRDLALSDSKRQKREDMENRVKIINEAHPDLCVSIHQNSYPKESIHGAQVFYYEGSREGKALAGILQESLVERVDPENNRQTKGNKDYYLLRNSKVPTAIVECGFLSNKREAGALCTGEYQDRIAWAVAEGIVEWLKQKN